MSNDNHNPNAILKEKVDNANRTSSEETSLFVKGDISQVRMFSKPNVSFIWVYIMQSIQIRREKYVFVSYARRNICKYPEHRLFQSIEVMEKEPTLHAPICQLFDNNPDLISFWINTIFINWQCLCCCFPVKTHTQKIPGCILNGNLRHIILESIICLMLVNSLFFFYFKNFPLLIAWLFAVSLQAHY